jgi:enamine deaminase RidA (YjgF/YER057c/UK114 family)
VAARGKVELSGAFERLFREASEAVAGAGLRWGDALICNLYLRSMDNFAAVNAVYCRYVTKVGPPTTFPCLPLGVLPVPRLRCMFLPRLIIDGGRDTKMK